MGLFAEIAERARAAAPHIVLAEGDDERVAKAALRIADEGIARVSIVGNQDTFASIADGSTAASRIVVHDPKTSPKHADYAAAYYQLRQAKGASEEDAEAAMRTNLGFAAMMVRQGDADGTLGGAVATTADTVRAALQIVGKAKGTKLVSSFFLMMPPGTDTQPLVFTDCALIIQPSAEELADIAIQAAASFHRLTSQEPRVAMLSFSTLGSASHPSLERIRDAVAIARAAEPDLIVDGEIQFDAAYDQNVGRQKAPGSVLNGQANVFVFPNLDAGNIGYKIAQRVGGATAIGPVLQGLARPANDLSRGCSSEDVYQMIAVTAAQAASQS